MHDNYPRMRPVSDDTIATDTAYALERVKLAKERAERAATDPDQRQRLDDQECIACYYLRDRVGVVGDTAFLCGACGKRVRVSNSRDIRRLCRPCAKRLKLCRRCGGDIDMKHRRKPRDFRREDK